MTPNKQGKYGGNSYLEKYKTCIDHENIKSLEKVASVDAAGFFGTYHISCG
jgi:hypothetical protein